MFADIPTNMVVRKHFAYYLQKSSDTTVSFVCCCVDILRKNKFTVLQHKLKGTSPRN